MNSLYSRALSIMALAIVLLLPLNKLLSADSDSYVNDFGSCLIQAGASQDSRHPEVVIYECSEAYANNRGLHSWHSVSHCYDAYHYSALSDSASLLIYRGCASYF